MPTQAPRDCGSVHKAPSTEETWGPNPNREAVWNWCLLAKKKPVFASGIFLGALTTPLSRPRAQELLANAEQTQWCFVYTFASVSVFFGNFLFVIIGVLLILMCVVKLFFKRFVCSAFFKEREKEQNVGWLGRQKYLGGTGAGRET